MQWEKIFGINCLCAIVLMVTSCNESNVADLPEQKAFVLSETMMKMINLDTVIESQVQGVLNLNGKIVADENRLVEIFPIVGGNVISISVELGDYVKKGQTLGVIRSGEVAEYDRQLKDAQSDVAVAQKNLEVKKDLLASKLISEREMVEANKELEKAEAGLKRIQETFSIYGFNTNSEYHLKSPINGFVINKKINRDMTLPSGHDESVFTIAELNEVWAIANVYESDISKIKPGMDVVISTLSYPGEEIRGKIDKIFNVLDTDTKTMKVRMKIHNEDLKLKPEMIATTRVLFNEAKVLPSVPASAIIFDRSRQFVMVFSDRYNIETREVEVYKSSADRAWISSGLNPGEIVISKHQLFIYDALND
jgi:RND family efflux transporter, MFP subunit